MRSDESEQELLIYGSKDAPRRCARVPAARAGACCSGSAL